MAYTFVIFILATLVVQDCVAAPGVWGNSTHKTVIRAGSDAGSCCIIQSATPTPATPTAATPTPAIPTPATPTPEKYSLSWQEKGATPCVVEHLGTHAKECNLPALKGEIVTSITEEGIDLGGSDHFAHKAAQGFLTHQFEGGGLHGQVDLKSAIDDALLDGTCCIHMMTLPAPLAWSPTGYKYTMHWKPLGQCLKPDTGLSFVPVATACTEKGIETALTGAFDGQGLDTHKKGGEAAVRHAAQGFLAALHADPTKAETGQKAFDTIQGVVGATAAQFTKYGDFDYRHYGTTNVLGGTSTASADASAVSSLGASAASSAGGSAASASVARAASATGSRGNMKLRPARRFTRWAARQLKSVLRN